MKSILEVALTTKFNAEQIPAIMEIIGNTSNTEIAAEIILGIYKEPTVSEHSIINDNFCTLVSYNKWDNSVTYTYTAANRQRIYVNKDVAEDSITAENYKEHVIKTTEDGKWIYVTFPDKIETKQGWCHLGNWEQGASKVGEMQP